MAKLDGYFKLFERLAVAGIREQTKRSNHESEQGKAHLGKVGKSVVLTRTPYGQ